jgi:hypothetical protein
MRYVPKWKDLPSTADNQQLNLTGAAIPVFRASTFLRAVAMANERPLLSIDDCVERRKPWVSCAITYTG